jgi:hypothetical protein
MARVLQAFAPVGGTDDSVAFFAEAPAKEFDHACFVLDYQQLQDHLNGASPFLNRGSEEHLKKKRPCTICILTRFLLLSAKGTAQGNVAAEMIV